MKALILFFVLGAHTALAQLVLYEVEAQYLPAYNFLGPDYQVSNVHYTGASGSFAEFDGTNSQLGLSTGFVLYTGDAFGANGLVGPNIHPDASTSLAMPGYTPLSSLFGGVPTYDAAVLEFDFVPEVDSISISLVFGSEEYSEYVGSYYKDAFAVFISGPGIPGMQNIATLDNGQVISIETVHGDVVNPYGTFVASNPLNYVDNPDTDPEENTDIELDGFTRDTRAFMDGLIVGETYHLILCIADASDGLFDSAVFFESCETCNYTLGSPDQNAQADFRLYPNPADNILHIQTAEMETSYIVLDAMGNVVVRGNNQQTALDVSGLAPGVYYVRSTSGETKSFAKL